MYAIQTANVTIMVKDMNRSIKFYVEGLGLTLQQRWGDHYAQVSTSGVVIGLHPSTDKLEVKGISIGFGIDTIEDAENRLKELDVSYERVDDKSWIFAY